MDLICFPDSRSQRRMWASRELEAAMAPLWLMSTDTTPSWWPSRVHCSSSFSSDLQEQHSTENIHINSTFRPMCKLSSQKKNKIHTRSVKKDTYHFQTFTMSSSEPVTIVSVPSASLLPHAAVQIASSWAERKASVWHYALVFSLSTNQQQM